MSQQRGDPAADAMAHATDPAHDGKHHPRASVDAAADDDAHGVEPLGPIDAVAWSAGILGVGLGLVVAVCFVLAAGGIG
jgi:hypothetical protein